MNYFRRRNIQTKAGVNFINFNQRRAKVIVIHAEGFIQDWLSCISDTSTVSVHALYSDVRNTFWKQEYVFRKALSYLWSESHSHNLPPGQWLFVPRQWCSLPTVSFCASPLKGRDFLCLWQSFVWSPNWGEGRSMTKAVKLEVSMLWALEDLSSRMRDIQPLLLYYLGFLLCRPAITESLTTKSLRFQQNWRGRGKAFLIQADLVMKSFNRRLCSSVVLRDVGCWFAAISGQPFGPLFEGKHSKKTSFLDHRRWDQ